MVARDEARDTAKITDLDRDWVTYRVKRNLCMYLQKKYKANYYKYPT